MPGTNTFRDFTKRLGQVKTLARYEKASEKPGIWNAFSQSSHTCWSTVFGKPVSIIPSLLQEIQVTAHAIPAPYSYYLYILHGIVEASAMLCMATLTIDVQGVGARDTSFRTVAVIEDFVSDHDLQDMRTSTIERTFLCKLDSFPVETDRANVRLTIKPKLDFPVANNWYLEGICLEQYRTKRLTPL